MWSQCDRHFVGQHVVLYVVKWWIFVASYSNNIESVGLRKCPYYRYLIEKVTSTDVRTTNISQSLPYKMSENRWCKEITSLSPYVLAHRHQSRSWCEMSLNHTSLLLLRDDVFCRFVITDGIGLNFWPVTKTDPEVLDSTTRPDSTRPDPVVDRSKNQTTCHSQHIKLYTARQK